MMCCNNYAVLINSLVVFRKNRRKFTVCFHKYYIIYTKKFQLKILQAYFVFLKIFYEFRHIVIYE